ncbi:MAG: MATE family efflux transporter [Lachnospiraceae bacterium]|jgi:putative MATE family efflux protein|nr:MATE family efflux transporter [Lachnospiraceae bacterium]
MAQRNLSEGPITKNMLRFAFPMICGNMLQQLYNVVDTLIVGKYLGTTALAAVGSSYALMTFLTSILLGMCMGSGAMFSIRFGEKNQKQLQEDLYVSFFLIAALAVLINGIVFLFIDPIMVLLSVPADTYSLMREYLWVIFFGIGATFIYNYFAAVLRSLGNSLIPLIFLGISAVINIVLDLYFILSCGFGVAGAAFATILAQWFSGIGIALYCMLKCPFMRIEKQNRRFSSATIKEITNASLLTCLQQSVMNLGILMVQGLVNSFGSIVMAAFAAAVKIDAFAYMPLQDFGNAFSTFIAQNYGAKKPERIKKGIRSAAGCVVLFSLIVSVLVVVFSRQLLLLFIKPEETEVLAVGMSYLRTVGIFYFGIGALFMLYGLYRAINRPGMSLVLTVISLGTRVVLAYLLSPFPAIGVDGIWWAIPIGWFLADSVGIIYYLYYEKKRRGSAAS